jgi:tetratricopeptide (TPR) repeat protein
MYRFRSFLLVLSVALILGACSKSPSVKVAAPLVEVVKAVDAYEYDRADSLLSQMLQKDSSSYYANYGQGLSYERQMLYRDALGAYLVAANRCPDSGAVFEGLCRTYTILNSPVEAAEAAARWKSVDTGSASATVMQIRSLINASAYAKAEQVLDAARAAGIDKGMANLFQARLQSISQQKSEAAKAASDARSQGSETPIFFLALADYYEEQGLIDSAVWAGNRSYEVGRDPFYGYLNFQRCLRHRYYSDARKFIANIAEVDKSKIASSYLMVEYKTAADERNQLTRSADQLSRLRPNRYSCLFAGVVSSQQIGDGAITNHQIVKIRDLYLRPGTLALFREYLRWDLLRVIPWPYNPKEVMEELDSLRGWREALPRFQMLEAGAFLSDTSRARFDHRIDSLETAHLDSPDWLTAAGQILSEAPDSGQEMGSRIYRQVLKRFPNASDAGAGLITNLVARHKYSEAITVFSEAPGLTDRRPEVGLLKALAEAKLGKSAEAVATFEQCYPPVRGEAYRMYDIAMALARQEHGAEAQKIVARALELAPDDADVCLAASDVEFTLGNYKASYDDAKKGLQLEPNHTRLNSFAARAQYATGQKEEAHKAFEAILKKTPTDPDANLMYSRILADENTSPDRAQDMGRMAQLLGKLSMRPAINLYYVYSEGGRNDLALGSARHAVITNPDDPEAFFILGMGLINMKMEGAKDALQKAIALGLTGKQLETARQELAKL